ncbi:MAG TPA: hypothetical protein EYN67_04070 [Flavobacteriales bacterium]|nr:hypothetical protein [Flavobacteriales bacterium]
MRVHITYAEELEKIPELIASFLSDCTTSLAKQSSDVSETRPLVTTDGYATQAVERIDNIRKELARIDQRLEDAVAMLSGVHNARHGNVTHPAAADLIQEAVEEADSGETTG